VTHTSDPTPALHAGNIRAVLATMPDTSTDPILTSPPNWTHRDYTVADQYGHELGSAPSGETLRLIFREIRRVLANGTCWLNLADSSREDSGLATDLPASSGPALTGRRASNITATNLLRLPWRVAFAPVATIYPGTGSAQWAAFGRGTGTFCVSGAVVLAYEQACAQPACPLLGIDYARTVVVV
jgi:hypothetical protein